MALQKQTYTSGCCLFLLLSKENKLHPLLVCFPRKVHKQWIQFFVFFNLWTTARFCFELLELFETGFSHKVVFVFFNLEDFKLTRSLLKKHVHVPHLVNISKQSANKKTACVMYHIFQSAFLHCFPRDMTYT